MSTKCSISSTAYPAIVSRSAMPSASCSSTRPPHTHYHLHSTPKTDSITTRTSTSHHLQQQQQQQRVPQAAEPLDRDEELLRELQELGAERGMEADEEDEEED
mmetsp:Transcript_17574/g.42235  ORF Transcript_17574/g.42235 Transcript_17574/m.42235 type:complete len:103 (-) Transcript_17574:166-474(-)